MDPQHWFSVCVRMSVPETIFLLDFVRPDFLMFRTIAKGLILWDTVLPTVDWVESHVPAAMLRHCLVRPPDVAAPGGLQHLDYETLNQAGLAIKNPPKKKKPSKKTH
jgi:anaphase-promoting complex subunit 1